MVILFFFKLNFTKYWIIKPPNDDIKPFGFALFITFFLHYGVFCAQFAKRFGRNANYFLFIIFTWCNIINRSAAFCSLYSSFNLIFINKPVPGRWALHTLFLFSPSKTTTRFCTNTHLTYRGTLNEDVRIVRFLLKSDFLRSNKYYYIYNQRPLRVVVVVVSPEKYSHHISQQKAG